MNRNGRFYDQLIHAPIDVQERIWRAMPVNDVMAHIHSREPRMVRLAVDQGMRCSRFFFRGLCIGGTRYLRAALAAYDTQPQVDKILARAMRWCEGRIDATALDVADVCFDRLTNDNAKYAFYERLAGGALWRLAESFAANRNNAVNERAEDSWFDDSYYMVVDQVAYVAERLHHRRPPEVTFERVDQDYEDHYVDDMPLFEASTNDRFRVLVARNVHHLIVDVPDGDGIWSYKWKLDWPVCRDPEEGEGAESDSTELRTSTVMSDLILSTIGVLDLCLDFGLDLLGPRPDDGDAATFFGQVFLEMVSARDFGMYGMHQEYEDAGLVGDWSPKNILGHLLRKAKHRLVGRDRLGLFLLDVADAGSLQRRANMNTVRGMTMTEYRGYVVSLFRPSDVCEQLAVTADQAQRMLNRMLERDQSDDENVVLPFSDFLQNFYFVALSSAETRRIPVEEWDLPDSADELSSPALRLLFEPLFADLKAYLARGAVLNWDRVQHDTYRRILSSIV